MTQPSKTDPLTVEEMTEAAEHFMSLFSVVREQCPDGSVEDCLKIMEAVAKYAHSQRAKKRDEEVKLKFGFNKKEEVADA
jgi:hypothetical protein